MEQIVFFKPYIKPSIVVGNRELPMKSVASCLKPSLNTVCDKLCQFHGNCSKFFSDKCSRKDLATNFKYSHFF